MKPANQNLSIAKSNVKSSRNLILLGTLAALVASVACSSKPKPSVEMTQPAGATVRTASLEGVVRPVSQSAAIGVVTKAPAVVKPAQPKQITYKSRDYGVSFVYPWQYSYVSAKRLANVEELKPKADGDDGQFTLARIEIPKGFYPDTDFDKGYFTVSLNQNLSEEGCRASLGDEKNVKLQNATVNGTDYLWIETDAGGDGSAAKTRNYVTFANDTCYEFEAGVKTVNEHGLARELDPDQVFHRLDAIMATVKFLPSAQKPAVQQLQSAVEAPAPDANK